MKYSLRNCKLNDIDFVLELKALGMKWYIEKLYGWDENKQKDITLKEMKEHLNDMKIIQIDNIDVGVTTFVEKQNYFEVFLILIHPDYQNKGIASSLLKQYIQVAKDKTKRIIIKTYVGNPAQNLYKCVGFKEYARDDTHVYMEIK